MPSECCTNKHMITGKPALISFAGPASKQEDAADNINGGDSRYKALREHRFKAF